MSGTIGDRRAITGILTFSAGVFAFLVWFIYFRAVTGNVSDSVAAIPGLNATMNGLSACCLVAGYAAIRAGRRRVHMTLMISALAFSCAFLAGYLVYHYAQGDTPFQGEGLIRPIYFFILISHIACTAFALPMILSTFFFAARQRFSTHKKIARVTLPLWLYVSVTGVVIYFLLKSHS